MSGQQVPAATLRIIRFALLSGVLLFGVVIAYLTQGDALAPDPTVAPLFRLVFLVLALTSLGAVFVIRSAQGRVGPDRRGQLALVGWAVAEGTALLGGVCWLIAGQRILYFTGVALFVVSLLLLPASDAA